MKKLKLSRGNKMIAGVCGGIAEYLNFDATLVRILFAACAFATALLPVAAFYLVLWAIMPLPKDEDF